MMEGCKEKKCYEVANSAVQTCTFDIFDTLFTRRTALPIGIFKIMQSKLQQIKECPCSFADNFVLIRTEAERFARRNAYDLSGAEDVTLDEIYNLIQENYNLSNELIFKIKKLEIELEINNIVPLKKNIEFFKSLKCKKNYNVILVSDMYLPSDVIKEMLKKTDPCFEDVKLYLSCECNHKTKHYGSLYNYVKEKENLSLNNWIHYGDNPHADIAKANENGVKSVLIPQIPISKFGNFIINNDPEKAVIDAIVGASRLCDKDNMTLAYKLGSRYTGPLLYSYVNWVINKAVAQNFKDLYFVARDGYILKLIADEILKNKKINIESHYLYGSRCAWRIATFDNYDDFIDLLIDDCNDVITIQLLAKKLDISENDLNKFIKGEYIDVSNKKLYKNYLKNNIEFKNFLLKMHEGKRKNIIGYMKQECDFSSDQIVLVDLDGSGKTQDCLQEAISSDFQGNVYGNYFLLFPTAIQKEKSQKCSYFLTESYFENWIEILTRNCEGQVLSYKKENNRFVPVLDKFDKQAMIDWGFEDYISGIKEYIKNILKYEEINNIQIDSLKFFLFMNRYIKTTNDPELAEVLGSIVYEEKILSENKQYATALSLRECVLMLLGKKDIINGNLCNIRIARSSLLGKKIYEFYCKYGSLRKFLINIDIKTRHSCLFAINFLGFQLKSKSIAKLIKKCLGR